MANDIRENRRPAQEKSTSLGFYCGLLAGQTSADYPSLTADLPKYILDPYDAKFLATPRLLNPAIQVTVVSSGDPGQYQVRDALSPALFFIRGSLPVVPPFVMARECRYFGFSPYLMKENKK